jgi:death-on-curing protein
VVVFYGLNGIDLDAPDDAAYDLVIAVASGQQPYAETAVALCAWH